MNSQPQDTVKRAFRQCLPGIFFTAAISFFTSALMLTVPLYMMQIFDRVLGSRSESTLVALTVIAVAALVVFAALDYVRARIYLVLSHWLSRRLSLDALQATVLRSLRGRGNPSQALRDLNDLRLFLSSSAMTSVLEALWAPMFFLVLFLLHPMYGVVSLIGAGILVVLGVVNELLTHRALTEANEAGVKAYTQVGSALRNAEAIEAMGLMGHIVRRWRTANEETLRLTSLGAARAALISSLSRSIRFIIQIAILATGVLLVIDRSVSPGSIFAAAIIMGRSLAPFEQLIDGWRQWVFASAAYRRVRALFEEGADARSTMPLPRPEGRLEVERLVFVPPGSNRPALKGLSVRLEPGEALGVIGPSAAGKSTLARLLVGVWKPTAGAVRLDGHEVYVWNRENFGQYVGYLPQNVSLFDGTMHENIARLAEADPLDVVAAAKKANVHDMIGRLPFGYDTEIGDGNFLLTGGQRQRIALARALFGNPSLLVLDEPDANLDQAGEDALVRAIIEAKAAGTTVVVVTHRQSVLQAMDKLIVLKDGALEQSGWRRDLPHLVIRTGAQKQPPSNVPAIGGTQVPRLTGS
jgi:ATP-binding cassette subfamily C protein